MNKTIKEMLKDIETMNQYLGEDEQKELKIAKGLDTYTIEEFKEEFIPPIVEKFNKEEFEFGQNVILYDYHTNSTQTFEFEIYLAEKK